MCRREANIYVREHRHLHRNATLGSGAVCGISPASDLFFHEAIFGRRSFIRFLLSLRSLEISETTELL